MSDKLQFVAVSMRRINESANKLKFVEPQFSESVMIMNDESGMPKLTIHLSL
jgi:hypothetical protein